MSFLSVYMITLNEELRLPVTLKGLQGLADEIIIVDAGSIDRTQEIARSFGSKVFFRPWDNYSSQKKFAENLCSGDWLMNIDADEEISIELSHEIRKAIEEGQYDAFRLRIMDVFPGQARPYRWVKGYNIVRLYRRGAACMGDTFTEDRVGLCREDVKVGQLRGMVYHHSMISISQIVDKFNKYTDQQVDAARYTGKRYSPLRMFFSINTNFFRHYILHRQFLNGYWGYICSVNFAYMRFLKFAKHYEEFRKEQC
ncbi:MAG: glycosyltransferase family 2 protein [Synergistales bacterium]|nr:glycosyltransferase family 2 protein [Synergistales bacterium]